MSVDEYIKLFNETSHRKCPECGAEVEVIKNPKYKTADDLEVIIVCYHKKECKHAYLNEDNNSLID